jgi:hypothetical protein
MKHEPYEALTAVTQKTVYPEECFSADSRIAPRSERIRFIVRMSPVPALTNLSSVLLFSESEGSAYSAVYEYVTRSDPRRQIYRRHKKCRFYLFISFNYIFFSSSYIQISLLSLPPLLAFLLLPFFLHLLLLSSFYFSLYQLHLLLFLLLSFSVPFIFIILLFFIFFLHFL